MANFLIPGSPRTMLRAARRVVELPFSCTTCGAVVRKRIINGVPIRCPPKCPARGCGGEWFQRPRWTHVEFMTNYRFKSLTEKHPSQDEVPDFDGALMEIIKEGLRVERASPAGWFRRMMRKVRGCSIRIQRSFRRHVARRNAAMRCVYGAWVRDWKKLPGVADLPDADDGEGGDLLGKSIIDRARAGKQDAGTCVEALTTKLAEHINKQQDPILQREAIVREWCIEVRDFYLSRRGARKDKKAKSNTPSAEMSMCLSLPTTLCAPVPASAKYGTFGTQWHRPDTLAAAYAELHAAEAEERIRGRVEATVGEDDGGFGLGPPDEAQHAMLAPDGSGWERWTNDGALYTAARRFRRWQQRLAHVTLAPTLLPGHTASIMSSPSTIAGRFPLPMSPAVSPPGSPSVGGPRGSRRISNKAAKQWKKLGGALKGIVGMAKLTQRNHSRMASLSPGRAGSPHGRRSKDLRGSPVPPGRVASVGASSPKAPRSSAVLGHDQLRHASVHCPRPEAAKRRGVMPLPGADEPPPAGTPPDSPPASGASPLPPLHLSSPVRAELLPLRDAAADAPPPRDTVHVAAADGDAPRRGGGAPRRAAPGSPPHSPPGSRRASQTDSPLAARSPARSPAARARAGSAGSGGSRRSGRSAANRRRRC